MELNISKVLSLLLVRLKYIILIALIFAFAFFGYSKYFVTEKYTSSAKFLVVMDEDSSKSTEANFVKEAIHSYLEIFNTTKFFNEVADIYNTTYTDKQYTASSLKAMTSMQAASNEEAPSFTIRVSSSSPDMCYTLANTVADHMIVKAGEYKALNKIELIDDPIKPVVPSSPDVASNTFLGFFFGAAFCCGIIICKELFDKKIKNLEDITSMYDIPILGVVPDTSADKKKKSKKTESEEK